MQTPRDIHLDCVKRVLRYVSETMDYDILYKSVERFDSKGTVMSIGLATKPTDDQHQDSSSSLVAAPYRGAVRSNRVA